MRRRDLVCVFGAALLAPAGLAAAQTDGRVRKIGALLSQTAEDPEGQARIRVFREGLAALGWTEATLSIEPRWAGGNNVRLRQFAEELVAQNPDAILASATNALVALQRATRIVPIVFAQVTDPVRAGFVASLSRPGGNITGVTQHEFEISGKWIELLKQIAPHVRRVAVLFDPVNPVVEGYLVVMRAAAASADMQVTAYPIADRAAIARALDEFTRMPGGGVILLPGTTGTANRDLVIGLAARHRLPSIFAFPYHVASGGLASYGVDNLDLFRRAAWYVDRILRGAKPGDLPVEHATKFRLVVNLKTAKALGLDVPLSLLTSADEVIE